MIHLHLQAHKQYSYTSKFYISQRCFHSFNPGREFKVHLKLLLLKAEDTVLLQRNSLEDHVAFSGPSFRAVNQYYLERGPIEEDVEDGFHHFVWDDNSEYQGEWIDRKANGRGTFYWPSGIFLNPKHFGPYYCNQKQNSAYSVNL